MTPQRSPKIAGAAEPGTLLLMLINLTTVHAPAVSSTLGALHGFAYIATVVTSVLVSGGERAVGAGALLPGLGGLLASRQEVLSASTYQTDRWRGEQPHPSSNAAGAGIEDLHDSMTAGGSR